MKNARDLFFFHIKFIVIKCHFIQNEYFSDCECNFANMARLVFMIFLKFDTAIEYAWNELKCLVFLLIFVELYF